MDILDCPSVEYRTCNFNLKGTPVNRPTLETGLGEKNQIPIGHFQWVKSSNLLAINLDLKHDWKTCNVKVFQ